MMQRHALRSLLFAAVLAAAPVVVRATPIHEDGAGTLVSQPTAPGPEPIAVDSLSADRSAPFSLDTTSKLEESTLALIEDASLDTGEYREAGARQGNGFLWAFALTGCGALGMAAFRGNEG